MKRRSCAFTGHRPEKFPWKDDETDSQCIALKAVLIAQIAELAGSGVTDFLSGMARGVDTWTALAVLALRDKNPKIKLRCILPDTTQANQWSDSEQETYHQILKQADSIVYVSRESHRNSMMDRNRFMADHADVLLAVCSNIDERRGGTAATVRYAKKASKKIILLDPITLSAAYL